MGQILILNLNHLSLPIASKWEAAPVITITWSTELLAGFTLSSARTAVHLGNSRLWSQTTGAVGGSFGKENRGRNGEG